MACCAMNPHISGVVAESEAEGDMLYRATLLSQPLRCGASDPSRL